jgi:nuclear receptor co-repressor 2
VEAQEDYLRREAKLLKREGTPPPPPPPRDLTETYKPRPLDPLGPLKLKPTHEGVVATVKEAGRSIHEIPREELRRTPELPLAPRPLKEGSITQVRECRGGGHGQAWGVLMLPSLHWVIN